MVTLRWPLDDVYVTQGFGPSSDPELQAYYESLGWLGHNGIDLRAEIGTVVRASHDGWCLPMWSATGLGDYVRVHGEGFWTGYGHLLQILVVAGEQVQAGQPVALSGDSGHVTAPHLHWELHIDDHEEDEYGGKVDPTLYLEEVNMKLGWHAANQARPTTTDWSIMELVAPKVLLFIPPLFDDTPNKDNVRRVMACCPDAEIFIRPYFDPNSLGDKDAPNYDAAIPPYIDRCKAVLDTYAPLIPNLHMQIFNEPNMPRWSQWEGFGDTPDDMRAFNRWFCYGYEQIKSHLPECKIGFTPLTIGNRDVYFAGDDIYVNYYMHGIEASKENPTGQEIADSIQSCLCKDALFKADEYYAHVYVHEHDGDPDSLAYGLRADQYAKFFPKQMDIWVVEGGYPSEGTFHGSERLIRWFTAIKDKVSGIALWKLGKGAPWDGIWYDGDNPRHEVYDIQAWQQQEPNSGFTDIERTWSTLQRDSWPATMRYAADKDMIWVSERQADNGVDVIMVSYNGHFWRTKLDGHTWQPVAEERVE